MASFLRTGPGGDEQTPLTVTSDAAPSNSDQVASKPPRSKKTDKCSSCGQVGHRMNSKECPNNSSNKLTGRGTLPSIAVLSQRVDDAINASHELDSAQQVITAPSLADVHVPSGETKVQDDLPIMVTSTLPLFMTSDPEPTPIALAPASQVVDTSSNDPPAEALLDARKAMLDALDAQCPEALVSADSWQWSVLTVVITRFSAGVTRLSVLFTLNIEHQTVVL